MSDQPDAPRRRRRAPQQTAQPTQGSAAKGVILVVVAVLIGFALLQDQDAGTADVSVGADDDPTTTIDGDDDAAADSTSTTTVAPRPPADVRVLVANGSDVDGAAGALSDSLEALGYVTANPTNAQAGVPETMVYFEPGYQPEAEELAAEIRASPENVTPLPTPAPVSDMQLANVLVVVGPDVATTG